MKMYRAITKNGLPIVTVFSDGDGPSLGDAISRELNRPNNPSRMALYRKWQADGMLTEEVKRESNVSSTSVIVASVMKRPTTFNQYKDRIRRKGYNWSEHHATEMLHDALKQGTIKRIDPPGPSYHVKYISIN
jgi:hypothetical protein